MKLFLRVLCLVLLSAGILMTAKKAYALVRISNLSDFAFGSWSGTGSPTATDSICIYDTAANPTYRLRFRGSGSGFAFTMTNGATTVAYGVEYRGSTGSFVTVTANADATYGNAHSSSSTCGGVPNGSIRVTIPEANLQAVPAGNYTGTITILLRP